MNKFTLAALGAVTAHRHHGHRGLDWEFDHNVQIIDTVSGWIYGEDPVEVPQCNLQDGDRMDDTIFYREMVKGIVNSYVKGKYHEDSDRPVSEECFGDWIDSDLDTLVGYKDKLFDDFWSIGYEDATKVSHILTNGWYKNLEACDFERITDDTKHWCLDNTEKCVGLSSIFDNLYDNGPAIASKVMDLYDLFTTDDVCFSD